MTATANNTASKFDAMGKEALRVACREAGISYSKLTNAGMRAALVAHYAQPEDVVEQAEVEEVVEAAPARPNLFASLLNTQAVPASMQAQATTIVRDGKRVEAAPAKGKSEPRARTEKPAAPAVPRASRKGYTIQKEREERNGVKRPSEGTVCGNVWAEFDKNPEIKASELADLADTNGWNRTNVSCEFYSWRKFMGIKGRVSK